MNRWTRIFIKIIIATVSISILLIGSIFFFLQTAWSKDKIRYWVMQKAKQQGLPIYITKIEGIAPFKWFIESVILIFEDRSELHLENIRLRIDLLDLLKNKLTISYLSIAEAIYQYAHPKIDWSDLEKVKLKLPTLTSLPFSLSTRHFHIRALSFENRLTHEKHPFSLRGEAKIKQDLSEIKLNLSISTASSLQSFCDIFLEGSEKRNTLEAKLVLNIPSTRPFEPLIPLPFETQFFLSSSWKGSWNAFSSLAHGSALSGPPIHIALTTTAKHLSVPLYPVLNDTWKLKGAFLLYPDGSMDVRKLDLSSSSLNMNAKMHLNSNKALDRWQSEISCNDLVKWQELVGIDLSGPLNASIYWNPQLLRANIQSPSLSVGTLKNQQCDIALQATGGAPHWQGSLEGWMHSQDIHISLSSNVYKDTQGFWVKNGHLRSASSSLDIEGVYYLQPASWEANLFLRLPSLKELRSIVKADSNLDGSIAAHLQLKTNPNFPYDIEVFHGHAFLKNIRYFDVFLSQLQLNTKAKDLFTHPSIDLEATGKNLLWKRAFISNAYVKTEENGQAHPFLISLEGNWKGPCKILCSGLWKEVNHLFAIDLTQLDGLLLNKPIHLLEPSSLLMGKNQSKIDALQLSMDTGTFQFNGALDPHQAILEAKASHLPIDTLTLSQPGLFLSGTTSFEGKLQMSATNNQGHFYLTLEKADLSQQGKEDELHARGSLQAYLDGEKMQIFSHLYASDQQFIDATATLPLHINHYPLSLSLDYKQPFSLAFTGQGALESLFDFIQWGGQKASGLITSHLIASNHLDNPALQGDISLQNGSYENYFSGTRLFNLEGNLLAEKDSLRLLALSGKDKKLGFFDAYGEMTLSPFQYFPFHIHAELEKLRCVDSELLAAECSGDLSLEGSLKTMCVKGEIATNHVEISLSENLPEFIPELNITFIHKPIHLEGSFLTPSQPYPLCVDMHICAKDSVFVRGRGLNSEWKGDIKISGMEPHVTAEGSLSLIKGDYTFSGKKFSLMQGEIVFKDNSPAFIKINGLLQLPEMQVQVAMQGPLTSPTLTLQSIPHMPTSSILARILFNKDISEITAVQALQLANVIVSMSGTGGKDLLESIRKSIGVDRLTIVGKEGSDEISLQIGWYLTHGVTVSLSQSATSSDVIVEVDLKHGFIFQAETQNQEEGKFSIKWNKNY